MRPNPRRPSRGGDDELLGAARIVDLQVPGRILRRLLGVGEGVVAGVGPAEDDFDRSALAAPGIAGHLLARCVEAHEIDGDPAVFLVRIDRRHHVAIGERGHSERLLDEAGTEIDLGEAAIAEARVRGAVGVEAADHDDRLRVGFGGGVALVARDVDLAVGAVGDTAQVVGFVGGDEVGEGVMSCASAVLVIRTAPRMARLRMGMSPPCCPGRRLVPVRDGR